MHPKPAETQPDPPCLLSVVPHLSAVILAFSKAAVEDVRAKNLICILDVDIQGVKRIKETDLDPIYISIQPPSMEILVMQLIYACMPTLLLYS